MALYSTSTFKTFRNLVWLIFSIYVDQQTNLEIHRKNERFYVNFSMYILVRLVEKECNIYW